MPGLATRNSVFAWKGGSALPVLATRTAVTTNSDTINLRTNTATAGTSVDVPTWAAGAVIQIYMFVDTQGTSTYHAFSLSTPISSTTGLPNATPILVRVKNAASLFAEWEQVVMPFFDEPIMNVSYTTNGTGTGTYDVRLLGFVRNV
jgi:hypothetical protein